MFVREMNALEGSFTLDHVSPDLACKLLSLDARTTMPLPPRTRLNINANGTNQTGC